MRQQDLSAIYAQFQAEGEFLSGEPYGDGHINDTYAIRVDRSGIEARYVLQRVNHNVFRDVPALMENVTRVCRHAQDRLAAEGCADADRRSLTLVSVHDGGSFYRDGEGSYWRVYKFIEGAVGYSRIENSKQAFEAARAFGEFQKLLVDIPGERLNETIPDFHNTRKRVQALEASIDSDVRNRAACCAAEIEWVLENRDLASALLAQHEQGLMPERATHNDTKLNNVLIDTSTNEAVCVIDLDTMMPGLALYDFGDLVRSSTSSAAEDERDSSKAHMQMDIYEALVRGYVSAAHDFLTAAELESLAVSGMVLTYECGVRFLSDYLDGDIYFKTHRPEHNLDRCRMQFALVRSMKEQREAMENVTATVLNS